MLVAIPSSLGYPALGALILGESAGLPLPGETALLTAGGLVAAGHLSLPLVIVVAALAATVGDTVGYWVGRRGGRAFLLRGEGRFARHRHALVRRADRFFARYGVAAVFLGRWVPGVRIVAALTAGASRMSWPRFAVANATGAVAWAASVATLAMFAGPRWSVALVVGGLALAPLTAAVAWWRVRRASGTRARVEAGAAG